ncbi:tripartite ATP-independent transporter DctP family solute receptor [Skermanella aerolata]|uniref:ABC transporter substrate-binding protein n=1 Tax=Skermanella aerolata TaxID=393310 RepID=A0A512DPT2_9PROT|nr:TRAP transporter substrate-binding protein [Skermanella aerolata]GEO38493.1 ABC transporter substrate-binding protein [Skermanella aerolata]
MKRAKFYAGVLLAGLMAAAPAGAADIKERNIKVGIGLTADHPQGQAVAKFGELVSQKSDGKIKVKLFAGGLLGNDVSMVSSLQGGTQEMTIPDTSTLVGIAGLKEFGLINLPFALNSSEEADALLDGPWGQKLMAKLPEKGLVGLGFWENGFRQISNNRHPIAKAEDISGLKLRVIQNPLFIDTFKALGANALPMPFPEVYTALETGTVDGQENPLATLIASKFYEVQKHTVISNHIYSVWAFLISKKFWDKLSPDEQKILTEAANEATAFERKTIRAFDATALEDIKSKGIQVTTLSDEETAKLREITKPVSAKFIQEFGEAGAKEMMAELEKIRAGKN